MLGKRGHKAFGFLTGLMLILAVPALRGVESTTQSEGNSSRSLFSSERHEIARHALSQAISAMQETNSYHPEYPEVLARVAEVQAKLGHIQDALKNARELKRRYAGYEWVFVRIVEAQVKMGNAHQALETAREIEFYSDRIRALVQIAQAQARMGNRQEAWAIAQKFRLDNTRIQALIAIAEAFAETGDSQGVEESFSQALSIAAGIDGDNDRVEAFGVIAEAFVETGYVQDALNTIDKIRIVVARADGTSDVSRTHGTIALVQAFIGIANSRINVGDAEGAQEFLSQARWAAMTIFPDFDRGKSLARVAKAQVEAGYFDDALGTVGNINNSYDARPIRESVILRIVQALANAGRIQDAHMATLEIQGLERAGAFCDIARTRATLNDTQGARKYLSEAFLAYLKSKKTALCVAAVQTEMGNVQRALDTLKINSNHQANVSDHRAYVHALIRVAKAQAIAGNAQNAKQLFSQALSRRFREPEGEGLMEKMQRRREHAFEAPEIAFEIGQALAEVGYVQEATNTLQEIGENHAFFRLNLLIEIAKAQVKAAAPQEAERSLSQALLIAQRDDDDDKNLVFNRIAEVQAEAGYFRSAMDTAQYIDSTRMRAKAFSGIAKALAEPGNVPQ